MQDTFPVEITREIITPEIAKAMLEGNTRNRAPSKRHVLQIAAAMRAGTFHFTGDPIRIAQSGLLIDGQHRLNACIQADASFDTMVIRNLPESAMIAIDGGKARTVDQQLTIAAGITKSATNTVLMLCRMSMTALGYGLITPDQIKLIIDRHPIITATANAYDDCAKFTLGANIPAGELILKAAGYHDEAAAWRDVWINGNKPELAIAASMLREHLIKVSDADAKNSTRNQWRADFRRQALSQTITLTAAHVPGPRHYKPGTIQYPHVAADELLHNADFNTPTTIPLAQFGTMTNNALAQARRSRGGAIIDAQQNRPNTNDLFTPANDGKDTDLLAD